MTSHKKIDIVRVVSMLFFLLVNFVSFSYVAWKTVQCVSKYCEDPKGTELSIQKSSNRKLAGDESNFLGSEFSGGIDTLSTLPEQMAGCVSRYS